MSDIGRLALRVEGKEWVAYYALTGTMDGALRLASIQMQAIAPAARKEEFITLMKNVVADLLEDITNSRPGWSEPQSAPEHEKAGRA
jgi:hypothetical protein